MAPREISSKSHQEDEQEKGRSGGKVEWKLSQKMSVKTYQLSFRVKFIYAFHPNFSVRVSNFYSYFCVIRISVLSLSTWLPTYLLTHSFTYSLLLTP